MIEDSHSFKDIWKDRKMPENPCKICGGIPELVSGYDEMDKWWYIKCKCGFYIDLDMYSYGVDPCEVWERLNSDEIQPYRKPKYVGKMERCINCALNTRCVEAWNMSEREQSEHVCSEYQKAKKKS